MSKTTVLYETDCLFLPAPGMRRKRNPLGLSTSDFRRLLTDLKQRPPSQRSFLRKLLSRAIAHGASKRSPYQTTSLTTP
jgi:hypothetical protein